MPKLLRWPIGVVAIVGAVAMGHAASTAGEFLPQGAGPVYVMAAAFAAIAGLCFWPWPEPSQPETERKLPQVEDSSPSNIAGARHFANYAISAGCLQIVAGLLGRVPKRFGQLAPDVLLYAGVTAVVLGGVALVLSSSEAFARAGSAMAKGLLWLILFGFVAVPIVALLSVMFGSP